MSRLVPLLAFATAVAFLGVGIERAAIAASYSDPVGHIRAQDESMYANAVQRMVRDGDWLTPRVLGRLWLLKPPLLVWLSSISVKTFGWSLWALRLPALIAAAAGCAVMFWFGRRAGSQATGWVAMLLLLSNALWQAFGRLCYTDTLFVSCTIGCVAILYADPRMRRMRSACGFAVLAAAAFMDKSVAGFLPLLVLTVFALSINEARRPPVARLLLVFAATAALALPWHVYQLIAHPQWFWADYVRVQLLQFGLHPPAQTTAEGQIEFYARRLFATDPLLWLLTAAALPFLFLAWRKSDRALPVLLGAWLFSSVACAVLYSARNLPYALSTIPPACLIAAVYVPVPSRFQRLVPALLFVILGIKAVFPTQPWGLRFGAAEPLPSAAELRQYGQARRSNLLIVANPDDQFYSCTVLPRVHYYFLDPNGLVKAHAPHYSYLGITTTVDDFSDRDRFQATYAPRLREWGLDSTEPLATAITSSAEDGLPKLILAAPEFDYYITHDDLEKLAPIAKRTHDILPLPNGHVFLLSRDGKKNSAP